MSAAAQPEGQPEAQQPQSNAGRAGQGLGWLVGVLVTLGALWFLLRSINWADFWRTLTALPLGSLALVVVIYLISMLARVLAWQTLLQRKVSVGRALLALNEGYFINNVLPLRLGELARALLLGRHSGLGMFQVLSTVVVERAYDLAYAAGLLLVTLPLVLQMEWARPVATALLAVIVLGLAALVLAARYRVWLEARLIAWFGRWGWFQRWVMPQISALLQGFSVLTRPDLFIISFALMGASWGLAILRDWVLLNALVPGGAPAWWAALAISASNLGGALPSAAASLGVFEAAAVAALALVGVPNEAGLAYALIVHVVHLISTTVIGGAALSREGESLAQIYARLRSVKKTE